MERNRRIAKAYSRVPVLTISGSDDGFDGYKIGLNGFDNPMRDSLTKTVKSHIGKVRQVYTVQKDTRNSLTAVSSPASCAVNRINGLH